MFHCKETINFFRLHSILCKLSNYRILDRFNCRQSTMINLNWLLFLRNRSYCLDKWLAGIFYSTCAILDIGNIPIKYHIVYNMLQMYSSSILLGIWKQKQVNLLFINICVHSKYSLENSQYRYQTHHYIAQNQEIHYTQYQQLDCSQLEQYIDIYSKYMGNSKFHLFYQIYLNDKYQEQGHHNLDLNWNYKDNFFTIV